MDELRRAPNGTHQSWFRIVRANQVRPEQENSAAPQSLGPGNGLGTALAMLPPPWSVFRRGGLAPFDGKGPEIYGGLYIALHPERGIALIDVAPARPDRAVPRLVALLRKAGLPEFSEAAAPIVALTVGRGELRQVGLRLGKAFEAAPFIRNPGWTRTAIATLQAHFPDLRQVQRAGEAEPELAIPPQAEAEPSVALPDAAAAAARGEHAATPPDAAEPQPTAPRLGRIDPRIDAVDPRPRSFDLEPPIWESWLARSRMLPGLAIATALVVAAVILVLLQHNASTGSGTPTASLAPAATTAPMPAAPSETPPASAPADAAAAAPTTPTPTSAAAAAPTDQALAPSPPSAPATPPVAQTSRAAGTASAPAALPAQTAAVPPSPAPVRSAPAVTSPPTKEAAQPAAPAAREAARKKPTETATREDRVRPESSEPVIPPQDLVTIDGVTYVKGREPHMLGVESQPVPPVPSAAATSAPLPVDHSQDVTPGSLTISPAPQGMPPR